MPRNLFRMSLKELKVWQEKLRADPRYANHGTEDLSPEGIERKLVERNYVVYERNVPAPWDDIEPGATVHWTLDNGLPVIWLNGTLYVWRTHLEKYQREHPKE